MLRFILSLCVSQNTISTVSRQKWDRDKIPKKKVHSGSECKIAPVSGPKAVTGHSSQFPKCMRLDAGLSGQVGYCDHRDLLPKLFSVRANRS